MTQLPPAGGDRSGMRGSGGPMDQMRDLVARSNHELAHFRSQAEAGRRHIAQMRDELRRETRDERAEGERAARDGELGPARQELQRRLDSGRTDWHQVMSGDDSHWSAVRVRSEVLGDVDTAIEQARIEDPDFASDLDARLDELDRRGH